MPSSTPVDLHAAVVARRQDRLPPALDWLASHGSEQPALAARVRAWATRTEGLAGAALEAIYKPSAVARQAEGRLRGGDVTAGLVAPGNRKPPARVREQVGEVLGVSGAHYQRREPEMAA